SAARPAGRFAEAGPGQDEGGRGRGAARAGGGGKEPRCAPEGSGAARQLARDEDGGGAVVGRSEGPEQATRQAGHQGDEWQELRRPDAAPEGRTGLGAGEAGGGAQADGATAGEDEEGGQGEREDRPAVGQGDARRGGAGREGQADGEHEGGRRRPQGE